MGNSIHKTLRKEKILIIDDETEICLLLSTMLKSKGYMTSTAHSLSEGESKVISDKPDIVILDINLPDGEGFELIPKIKEKTEAKIIMITARDGQREQNLAKKMEVDEFLRKPFSKKTILDIVEKYTQVS